MNEFAIPAVSKPSTAVVSRRNIVTQVVVAIFFSTMVFYCVVNAGSVNLRSVQLFHNQLDNTYPEGAHVFSAIRAAQTGSLYFSFREPPYIVQSYGPLFYLFSALIARFAHLSVEYTTLAMRGVSYACYLGCALLVLLICRKLRCSWLWSGLAALMMLGQHDFLGWNITVRPDMLMLLAMVLSLFFSLCMDEHPWLFVALSGLAAGLAFLIKSPGAGVAVSIVLVLAVRKEFRRIFLFSAAAASPVVGMFLGLLLHRESFWGQFTSLGKAYWSWREGLRFISLAVVDVTYIVPASIGLLGFVIAIRKGKSWQFIASFLLVNGLLGLSGLPQPGSNANYYLPGLVGCSLLLPLAAEFFQKPPALRLATLVFASALLYATYLGAWHDIGYLCYFNGPDHFSYAPLRKFQMLTDLPLLSMKGHDPDLLDSYAIHSLELTGQWDSTPVIDEIRDRKFDLVILTRVKPKAVFTPHPKAYSAVPNWRGISYFSPEEVSALNDNYDFLCSSIFSVVLKPKHRSVDISADYFDPLFKSPCRTEIANYPANLALADGTR